MSDEVKKYLTPLDNEAVRDAAAEGGDLGKFAGACLVETALVLSGRELLPVMGLR